MSTSLGRKAVGGAGATVLWQAVRLGLLALSIIILAHLLQPSDYGLMAMVIALVGIGELLRDLGLSVAAVQSKTLDPGEKSNLFWASTVIGLALTVLVFFASWPISALYGEPRLIQITQTISLTFALNGISTQFKAQLTRDLRFMALGAAEAIPQALGLAAAICMALWLGDYRALIAQTLVIAVVGLVLNVAWARWWPGLPDRRVSIRRFLRFGGSLVGTQGLAYLSKNVDTVAIGLLFGTSSLGIYNRAYQITVLPLTQLTSPLSRVAIPVLSRVQDDGEAFWRYLKSGQFFGILISATFYGAVVGLADPLITVFLGERWAAVIPILQALSVSGIFRAMGQIPYWIFVSKGLTGTQFRFYLITQPIIVLAIMFGLVGGPIGVALGCSAGYLIFWSLQMWWAGRVAQLNTFNLAVSGIGLASLLAIPAAAIGLLTSYLVPDRVLVLVVATTIILIAVGALIVLIPTYREYVRVAVRVARSKG